jgi:hypothetical protein
MYFRVKNILKNNHNHNYIEKKLQSSKLAYSCSLSRIIYLISNLRKLKGY